MLRLRSVSSFIRRVLHGGTVNRDQIMEQLQICSAEDQLFDVVAKNKATLKVNHVGLAVGMLWQFERDKPYTLRTVEILNHNPEFLALRVLAESKIACMDDVMLVDMLYCFLKLKVEPHDSLVQQLISEAWLRIDRLSMAPLSRFALCLTKQSLFHSPLMGHITSIVSQRLPSMDDVRSLSVFMFSVAHLVSPRLRDALIDRADHLLDTNDVSRFSNPRRVVRFLRQVKCRHQPLLEKCKKFFLYNMPSMGVEDVCSIMALYQFSPLNKCDLKLAVKQRLLELVDLSTDRISFERLFVVLAPMASREIRERLENTLLLFADELDALQTVFVTEALVDCRNITLLNKIESVIQRNLHVYTPMEVSRITKALAVMQYHNPQLLKKLGDTLFNFLQRSFCPSEVIDFTRVLLLLPFPWPDEYLISRVNAVVTQCNLRDFNAFSLAIAKRAHKYPTSSSKYAPLLQTLLRCGHKRLQKADRLDDVVDELRYSSTGWFQKMMEEETVVTLQRMMDQINWTNVHELASFLNFRKHLCPPLMDRIASVAIKDIDAIHHSAIHAILQPFALLNYEPPQADKLYDACIQRIITHLSSSDSHLLVIAAFSLAVADYFPEELVRRIFSIEFLGKLDAELETLPYFTNTQTRYHLMKFNRAACLECPEFQVPWFHEHFCQQYNMKGRGPVTSAQKKIHKMLGEVLGGINRVRLSVVTPYFYTIDFECILDKHLRPLPYGEPSTPQMSDRDTVHWGTGSLKNIRDELPAGAQRVAIDFLNSNSFCKNSHHIKGEALMRKRHLEILGYRVVQIPLYEWNSMEFSTEDAWKEYLKKKIFKEI